MTTPTSRAASEVSTTGLAANVAGAIAYLLGPVTGIILLVIEKDSRFVRFHAAQALVGGIALIVLSILLAIVTTIITVIPVLGVLVAAILGMAFSFGTFVLWVLCMWKAFSGEEWEVPVVGPFARRIAG
jgi:uncharacterized membrane protein